LERHLENLTAEGVDDIVLTMAIRANWFAEQ